MALQFEARLPAKKFRKHVCAGRSTSSDTKVGDLKRAEFVHAEEVVWADGRVAAEVGTTVA